ncbi:hypothetical protein [Arthrobacter sp. PAMC25284]|uniref:hypothetical protein n=1 Tax=Arthrobacter sp. PAMC25284 TaxID=2861279 RepID=UPI001C6347C8|nr:hypothetical protein [Arthrobacter sp. PAMC25284]QYF88551.1 hypothetical protein KY499_09730 [Arthrobacter sp. PAMC25284]
MNVQEAMAAYRDGTFEKKASAERRQPARQQKSDGGVQKGRDLYESMYPKKKEQ